MWTKEGIKKFIEAHPIDTGGPINDYEITTTEHEEGDEWTKVALPIWSHNVHVTISVLKFALDAMLLREDTWVYTVPAGLEVEFYTHYCDPD